MMSRDELCETIRTIKKADSHIKICILLRDCGLTTIISKSDYPDFLKDHVEDIDCLIKVKDMKNENDRLQKLNSINPVIKYFNESVREIAADLNQLKFTR